MAQEAAAADRDTSYKNPEDDIGEDEEEYDQSAQQEEPEEMSRQYM